MGRVWYEVSSALVMCAVLLLSHGCGDEAVTPKAVSGAWMGSFTERGKTHTVQLTIHVDETAISGQLKLMTGGGSDVGSGATFPILEAKIVDKRLQFSVPITGKLDDDSIDFSLALREGRLTGWGRERRKTAEKIEISFARR